MPVRPRVRDIVSIRFLAAPKCCQARGARQRAYCGKLLPPRAVAAAPEAETRRGSEKTGTHCPRRIPVRPVAGQPGRLLRLGRWLFRNAIWSARMLRLERIRCSTRSEEHTSELQSLMRISYAVFFLKKNTIMSAPYK